MTIKQRILKRKYEKCNKYIYIVCQWAKWGILKEKYIGIENGQPIIIKYNDNNGVYESYYRCSWKFSTSGVTVAYFFNETDAQRLCDLLNSKERYL